jgi:hypothetical protein
MYTSSRFRGGVVGGGGQMSPGPRFIDKINCYFGSRTIKSIVILGAERSSVCNYYFQTLDSPPSPTLCLAPPYLCHTLLKNASMPSPVFNLSYSDIFPGWKRHVGGDAWFVVIGVAICLATLSTSPLLICYAPFRAAM